MLQRVHGIEYLLFSWYEMVHQHGELCSFSDAW